METVPGNPERQARKTLWQEAAKDPLFLKDIKDVESAFRTADAEHLEFDAGDISAFEDRVKEPLVSYDEMVQRLKRDGLI